MEQYEKMSDAELLEAVRAANTGAVECLCQRYKEFVKLKSKHYFLPGADCEDLIQEGMIGLYQAMLTYDPEKGSSFRTYADNVISNHLYSAIKTSNRMKNVPLNNYVSLDAPANSSDEQEGSLFSVMERMVSSRNRNPEELVIDKENYSILESEFGRQLSRMEKKVFDLSLKGLDYREVARVLGKAPKSIDNALQRIKAKYKKFTEESCENS